MMYDPSVAGHRVGARVPLEAPLALLSRNDARTVRVGAEGEACGGRKLRTVEKAQALS